MDEMRGYVTSEDDDLEDRKSIALLRCMATLADGEPPSMQELSAVFTGVADRLEDTASRRKFTTEPAKVRKAGG